MTQNLEHLTSFSSNKKIFVILFTITFIIFLFTSDGHRYSPDEDDAQLLAKRIVTQQAHPLYVEGQTRLLFEHPQMFPNPTGPICQNPILCSPANIGYALTETPFVFLNHEINQFSKIRLILSGNDFDNLSYVYWRNSLDPDFLLLELLYGPLFSALSVGVFFLICRTFNYSERTSSILSLLYGLSSLTWAYSNTSLNAVPVSTFILLGYLFFRRYQKTESILSLSLCAASLGFGYLVRSDAVLIIAPLFIFMLLEFKTKGKKLKKFFAFILPVVGSFLLQKFVDYLNFGSQGTGITSGSTARITTLSKILCMPHDPNCTLFHEGAFGLFLSPGVGLLIFAPIFFTIFFSFPEFYKKHKKEFYLFITFTVLFLWYYGQGDAWDGLVGWGPRYLVPIIPFLLLPLGVSIEMRKRRFIVILGILGVIGAFFNFVNVIQDVPYFVWGTFGNPEGFGLYALGGSAGKYSVHPTVLWTFENSQLTHSIILAFEHLQVDVVFLKLLGVLIYSIILIGIIFSLVLYLIKSLGSEIKIFNKLSKGKPII